MRTYINLFLVIGIGLVWLVCSAPNEGEDLITVTVVQYKLNTNNE